MTCEHPACSTEANALCENHCHLSVCARHRVEHESNLLNEIQQHLDDLSDPLADLLSQTRDALERSEAAHRLELTRMHSLFDRHQTAINQRSKLARSAQDALSDKREQLNQHRIGERQVTTDDYQQLETLARQIKKHLHDQYQFNQHVDNPRSALDQWPNETVDVEAHAASDIEYIELTDSEDERSLEFMDTTPTAATSIDCSQTSVDKKPFVQMHSVRECCPLTKYGVFGLQPSHNIHHLCKETNNTPRFLYGHFTRTHRIKPSIATHLVRAIRNQLDPMETKIFPQEGDEPVHVEDIACPFNRTAAKFNEENAIPKTPCSVLIDRYELKRHLRNVHMITKANTELIYRAMVDHGTISHVQFEEDLCE